ncbi:MAG: CobW family GTP-binding protein [Bacteroidota bacterium]
MSKKIPFYLITGYLGSGKTSLVKHIIQAYDNQLKIGIIQNEFASSDVDGKELSGIPGSYSLLPLNNGSVFCLCLLGTFITSMRDFIEREKPDAIFLEATGLSDPIAIAEILSRPSLRNLVYLAHVWCMIDVTNGEQVIQSIKRTEHQVRIADTVVLNKTDLQQPDDSLLKLVKKINPFAEITKTSFAKVDLPLIHEKNETVAQKQAALHETIIPGNRPRVTGEVIKNPGYISPKNLENFLHLISGEVVRAKGFVRTGENNCRMIQVSGGMTEIRDCHFYNGPTEIVIMKDDNNEKNYEQLFKSFQHAN